MKPSLFAPSLPAPLPTALQAVRMAPTASRSLEAAASPAWPRLNRRPPLAPPLVRPRLPASPANTRSVPPRPSDPRNVLQVPHLAWGARTHVVRTQPLDAGGLSRLLAALSPPQFAFIRDNVFVPPALDALHAKLWATQPAVPTPLQVLLGRLTRGDRHHKLSYLFAFFHLSAGSHTAAEGGAWCSVASPRDARTLARVAQVLAPRAAAPTKVGLATTMRAAVGR